MGFLDRLAGRNDSQAAESDAAQPSGGQDFVGDVHGSAQASSGSRESIPEFSSTPDEAAPGVRLYNPYQGIQAAASRGNGLPAYKLPRQPEFLFSEEATVHRRSWSENLTFYTGSGYLAGAILGGGRGAVESVRTQPSDIALNTSRLKVNRLLNLSGQSGRAAGHSLGALGLFFSSFESLIGWGSDHFLPDEANTILAGALSGAVFRTPYGPRVALIAGGVGAVAASGLVLARANVSRHL